MPDQYAEARARKLVHDEDEIRAWVELNTVGRDDPGAPVRSDIRYLMVLLSIIDKARADLADLERFRRAVTVAYGWFAAHEYSGDGLNVCQVLREVSSPEEVEKARAVETRVLADTIAASKLAGRREALREVQDLIRAHDR